MRLAVAILLLLAAPGWALTPSQGAKRGPRSRHQRPGVAGAAARGGSFTVIQGETAARGGSFAVIQGETAARGEFPWQAQLKRDGALVCSAVLVSELWLVTAAHCLTANLDTAVYQVILGEYDTSVEEGSEQKRGLAEMVFSDLSGGAQSEPLTAEVNDIALIRLDEPAVLSAYVKAIDLPNNKEEFTDKTAVASGWGVSGSTIVGPVFPDKLQKLPMTLLSDSSCLDSLIVFNFVPGPMTCAAPPAGSSLCWGDSGGALTYYRFGHLPVLAAVTSWGVDCDLNRRPTVFVDVGFFADWIRGVIGAN